MNVGRVRAGGLIVPVIKDAGIFGLTGTAFAASFYRVGVKVAIVEMLDRVLSPLNKDITDFAEAILKKSGMELRFMPLSLSFMYSIILRANLEVSLEIGAKS